MGHHAYVVGFKPPDEKWKKMKAAYEACKKAGVEPPNEVRHFFEDCAPDECGVTIDQEVLLKAKALREWDDGDMCSGFEVDITKLPEDVTVIRFVNSF
jgi:hypothetical protein